MSKRHPGLPRAEKTTLSKRILLEQLLKIDSDRDRRSRVLQLETAFRRKVEIHLASLPGTSSSFDSFKTSPFVLLIHARQRGYSKISSLERDILPAKQFSSMETSAGLMVEQVVLPAYGWENVQSEMHTQNSSVDGRMKLGNTLFLATLKSGPCCLNDEMSENFADSILQYCCDWIRDAKAKSLDFTYGVLYGTPKMSNKKDWHILRNIKEKRPPSVRIVTDPDNRWNCDFVKKRIPVSVNVRVGLNWWRHLGGELCLVEVLSALIRACITPGEADKRDQPYVIQELNDIVSLRGVRAEYNVSLLQRNQLPWLFLMARHFCDSLCD